MRYDLIDEIHHEGKFYYLTRNAELLKCKEGLPMPNHPTVSLKNNQREYFELLESTPTDIQGTVDSLIIKHGLEDRL